jgi:hypothetical protein
MALGVAGDTGGGGAGSEDVSVGVKIAILQAGGWGDDQSGAGSGNAVLTIEDHSLEWVWKRVLEYLRS